MARFLTTTGVSYELEELIRGAEKWIVLISPLPSCQSTHPESAR